MGLLQYIEHTPDQVTVGALPKNENQTPETGMERVKKMFSLDEYGYQSKQLTMLTQMSMTSTLGGAIIGSVIFSRDAYRNFLENNQATKFQNHMDAKRALQRTMYLAFGRGAFYWGWRIGMFSTSYTTIMTTISVYHGKESLAAYLIAGGVTGALFRINLGPKGAFAGCLLGTFLGGIAGGASLMVLKAGGMTMDDISTFSKILQEKRNAAIRRKEKDFMVQEDDDLILAAQTDDSSFSNLAVNEE